MTGDTPEAAARGIAEHVVKKVRTSVLFVELEPSAYIEQITAALLAFRRAALEEAAQVAERHFVGMFTGWIGYCESQISLEEAEDAAQECGPICASAIRALAGSTKEGE